MAKTVKSEHTFADGKYFGNFQIWNFLNFWPNFWWFFKRRAHHIDIIIKNSQKNYDSFQNLGFSGYPIASLYLQRHVHMFWFQLLEQFLKRFHICFHFVYRFDNEFICEIMKTFQFPFEMICQCFHHSIQNVHGRFHKYI